MVVGGLVAHAVWGEDACGECCLQSLRCRCENLESLVDGTFIEVQFIE